MSALDLSCERPDDIASSSSQRYEGTAECFCSVSVCHINQVTAQAGSVFCRCCGCVAVG